MLILIFRARFYRNKTTFSDKFNDNLIFSSQNAVVRMEQSGWKFLTKMVFV
jgi:hypothetical protein